MSKVITIPLTQGKVALVDEEDGARALAHSWTIYRKVQNGREWLYAQARIGGQFVLLHVFIMGPKDGKCIDHIDGDGLNCRRNNMRHATHAQNMRNRRKPVCQNGHLPKGVSPIGKRWRARITVGEQALSLGIFETINEAAMAYDLAAIHHFGEFARLNLLEFRIDE